MPAVTGAVTPMIRGSFDDRSGCVGLVLAAVADAPAAEVEALVINVVGPDGDADGGADGGSDGERVVVLSTLVK